MFSKIQSVYNILSIDESNTTEPNVFMEHNLI